MYIQRFVIAAIVLPLAIAAPIANTAGENNSQVIQKGDKHDASLHPAVARSCNAQPENLANTLVNLGVASTSTTLRARQILWTLLGPLGFEPVVDGVNGALVGLGLK
ncbi:hypothetical protein H4I95_00788 [Botrytis cinerea]